MAISRKTNDAPKSVNLDRLGRLVERIEAKQSVAEGARSDLGTIYKEAEDLGFNRGALKLALKLRNMEPEKRTDFLSSLNAYCDKLGVFAQSDLFGDTPTGVGPDESGGSKAPTVNVAQLQGEKAGKAGQRIDDNPYDESTPQRSAWDAGWIEGQAEAVRRNIKPLAETEAQASA